jgi:FlaA1/EpsC-like NDP-sugar epimerase
MKFFEGFQFGKFRRNLGVFLVDAMIAGLAFVGAYLTVFGYTALQRVPALGDKTAGFVLASCLVFWFFGTHRGAWRYVSLPDLLSIIKAAIVAVGAYTVAAFLLTRGQNVPRSVPVLTTIYLVLGVTGIRIAYRLAVEQWWGLPVFLGRRHLNPRRVVLCGLTDKAESFIRSVRRNADSTTEIVGIFDDSPLNAGRVVQGIRDLGTLNDLEAVTARLAKTGRKLEEIIVTETAPSRQRLSFILEKANGCSLAVSRIPDFSETSAVTSSLLLEPRPIEIGDLLERPEVTGDAAEIARFIQDKVVLATGAGGSIGSELCRQIAKFAPRQLILTDSSEFNLYQIDAELRQDQGNLDIVTRIVDVRDEVRLSQLFAAYRPQVVFHAAALKHVPLVEDNPLEALKTNVIGTRNAADAAFANGTSVFVMISTDKAVNPTSVMGATKRAAEAYCQALDVISQTTRFKTVRFGNVLGSNGSVVPRFEEQIAAGGPVTVTDPNITRYFMTIPEAVGLVLHASARSSAHPTKRGDIMVLDMGKPVRILDLAERMIQLAGYKPRVDIDIAFTGLRPGEKLYEEMFDPSEVRDNHTIEGFFIASPRVTDHSLLRRTMDELAGCLKREDVSRALDLLAHIVPEYGKHRDVVDGYPQEEPLVRKPNLAPPSG